MSVVIIKTGDTVPRLLPTLGNFEDWFRAGLGIADAACIDVRAQSELPDAQRLSGVVVTGSAAMITERADWSVRTTAWLAEVVARQVPVLGVCYGHQMLAEALGGRAGWNPNGREIGSVEVELLDGASQEPLFAGLPSRLVVQATHSQSVLEIPPGARLLGRNAKDPNQAFAFGPCAWGIQFHPEANAAIMQGYLDERSEALREEGLDPAAISASLRDSEHGRQILRRFAHYCETQTATSMSSP